MATAACLPSLLLQAWPPSAYLVLAALLVLLLILLSMHLRKRREIKKISEALRFLQGSKSNLQFGLDYSTDDLCSLARELNQLLRVVQEERIRSLQEEEQFKNTIISLSHDIRTPLTSFQGYLSLLQTSPSQEDRERYLQVLRKRSDSLARILDELFLYSKLQQKNYHLEVENLDLKQELSNELLAYYQDFKTAGFQVQLMLPEVEVPILANKEALQRILQNIFKNALEHGKDYFQVKLGRNEDAWLLSCGNVSSAELPAEIETIFQEFYKADTARSKHSSGLGLAITKKLAEKMAIDVFAESKPAKEQDLFYLHLVFPASH